MKKLFSLLVLSVLCSVGVKAEDILFKMDVTATESQKAAANSDAAIIDLGSNVSCSGSAYTSYEYYQGQSTVSSSAGSQVTYIEKRNNGTYLRFTVNKSYLKVVLSTPLKANDIISFEGEQYAVQLGFSATVPTTTVTSPATTLKSYTVTAEDGICGKTIIYINRATNQTAGFASLSITRPATVTEKNTVSKLLSVGSLTEAVTPSNGESVTEDGITLYGNVSTYTGESYPSFSIAAERTFEDDTKAKNLIYLNGAPSNVNEINRCIKFTVDHPCTIKFYGAATGDGGRSLNYSLDEFEPNASNRTTIDGSNSAAKGTVAIGSLILTEGHDVYIAATGGYNVFCIKVIYDNWNVPVSELGWASLYVSDPIAIPEGVQAYYAKSATNETITLSEINDVIPAETGVIIKAAKGYYDFNVTTAPSESYTNLFEGVTEATPCEASANYVLSGESTAETPVFGLYTGTTLGAYKAYLPATNVPSAGQARIRFVFDGASTSIGSIENNISKKTAVKKIIRNGQIILETAKGTFNTFGARIK